MENQPLAAVVLAAGLGKRMASRQPKVLHRLAGLPLAGHVLRALAPLEPSRTILVVGHQAERVQAVLGDCYGPDESLCIEYVLQQEQLGTGHAILMAEPALREYHGPVLVMYGDTPLLRTSTLSALIARHRQSRAVLTMLTCIAEDPTGYGRVSRDLHQNLVEVVEEKNATLVQRAISEVNTGVYVFDSEWLWPHLERIEVSQQGEYYLTDLVGMAVSEDGNRATADPSRRSQGAVVTFTLHNLDEAIGINSRAELARAERTVQERLRQQWMDAGVTMLMPETVYLDLDVEIGPDTVVYPWVILEGRTVVGSGCVLGPNTQIIDSTINDECKVVHSVVEGSTLERGVTMGPFSHLRPGTHLGEGVHLGNFAEVNRSTLERGVRMGHFSYVGDAHVGEDANLGAGMVTANYDGVKKNRTRIGRQAFIGVGSMLRAPLEIGDEAVTGAGSVVLKDVPAGTVVAGVPARPLKEKESGRREEEKAEA